MSATPFADRIDAAEPVNIWRAPDMSIVSGGRSKAVPMSSDLFGQTWGLISDIAEGAGAPVDYVAMGLITVAASLIGGKRRVRPYQTGGWSEPCILWAAAVGDPSSNKSPALDGATDPLRGMEADHAEAHQQMMMTYEAKAQRAKAERKQFDEDVTQAMKDKMATPPLPDAAVIPDEPVRRRLLVQDGTPEAVAVILSGNPSGTLHLRDELAGWLNSFERYSPGGREFWLEAYGGRQFTIDRKQQKTALRIPFNGVSVLGGIQPEKLVDCLLSGTDDGLVARFMWAWPDPIPYQRPRQIADVDRLEAIYRRLDHIQPSWDVKGEPMPIALTLTDQAGDIFEAWVREHVADLGEAASLYKGFCGKLKGTVLRLSLVAELLAWADSPRADEPRTVGPEAVIAAIEFAESYLKPTAMRVFGDAALPAVERHAAAIARRITKERLERVNARDVQRKGALSKSEVADAIEHLTDADWLRPLRQQPSEAGGRPRGDFLVNPAIHGDPHE